VKTSKAKSPFKLRNIRLFIAFRIFFNSRFYYPVFTILFLDFGLSLEQFAVLNAFWAATIVLLEVPSGALADVIGRKNLLVVAGSLMVAEIALLCLVPRGNVELLFAVFLLNRIFSGAAEAAASGTDEALAYDTLKREGLAGEWPQVLEKQMRLQSLSFIVVTSLGAAVYDPELMQLAGQWLGLNVHFTQAVTLRFPLYLTLGMAILTLCASLRMREIPLPGVHYRGNSPARAIQLTMDAGRWILKTPFALVVILGGLLFDSCIRMTITLSSQYYRVINLPEASFGLIGSAFAILGIFVPRAALMMSRRRSPAFIMAIMAGLTLLGLSGMSFVWPLIGLLPMALIWIVMYLQVFFQSHYLNRITASRQRATILSFKGLSFNLAYGLIGIFYSILLAFLRSTESGLTQLSPGIAFENLVYKRSLVWFPWYFVVGAGLFVLCARWKMKGLEQHTIAG
jgi:MFS family permease